MPLAIGNRLGGYEILAFIGSGGMGEVYRARDTKLKRAVAVKVLPEAFVADPGRMARFQREAEVLASLNHPNIAQIYGVEERALVMELVEGESPKGPMPFEDAWKIAAQMADALEYAHDKGVVHRDLKPSNVKVTPDGVVKLLDFGLAKAFSAAPDSARTDDSPTVTLGATVAGVILGTAAYMAPEQARGKRVDKRADIWSWAVVLYELLAGEQMFQGEDTADTLAKVLANEPDLDRLPAKVRRLLGECLQKDPKLRLRDIGDARRLLEERPAMESVPSRPRPGWVWPGTAALLAVSLAAISLVHFREPTPAPQMLQYTIDAPAKTRITNFAISPDGRYVAMTATGQHGGQIWVRPLDSLQAQSLAGTEGATYPFWSTDSRYIGFFAENKLKKISRTGGPAQTLCDAPLGIGGTWNSENMILFATSSGLSWVSGAGGIPSKVTDATETSGFYRHPSFLPDGRRFLYDSGGVARQEAGIYLGSLDQKADPKARRRIIADISNAQYLPPSEGSPHGYIFFGREGTLMAQPVDPNDLRSAGDVFPVIEQVSSLSGTIANLYSISRNGIILHVSGSSDLRQRAIFDRRGKKVAAIGPPVRTPGRVALSPDKGRTISERFRGRRIDLWITELGRGTESRFTFDDSSNVVPVWSPDGSYVAFASTRGGVASLYRKPGNQAGEDELLLRSEFLKFPTDWSHDGRFIIFQQQNRPNSNYDLFALPVSGDRKPIPLLTDQFNEIEGTVSPDGRWLTYASDESGSYEVYVQLFAPGSPKPSRGKWQISVGGGRDPHWRGDGGEMFYVAPDRKMMAVAVKFEGSNFVRSTPRALFEVPLPVDEGAAGGSMVSRYAVSADGQRFLMAADAEASSEAPPLHVTVNWLSGLKR